MVLMLEYFNKLGNGSQSRLVYKFVCMGKKLWKSASALLTCTYLNNSDKMVC